MNHQNKSARLPSPEATHPDPRARISLTLVLWLLEKVSVQKIMGLEMLDEGNTSRSLHLIDPENNCQHLHKIKIHFR